MTIKLWPESERPRERLLKHGPTALSDSELLAIFFRTGVAGSSAVDLARDTLHSFGDLRKLLEASEHEFCRARGLGQAKYVQLQAVLEIAKRYLEHTMKQGEALSSSASVKQYLCSQLRHRSSEVFAALFLDSQNQLLEYKELFQGTIDSAAVYPREVVKIALECNCASVIFAHNHPSGLAEPSDADKRLTERLRSALRLVDIETLDHIVIGDGDTVSFAERGWL